MESLTSIRERINGKIYIYLANEQVCRKFYADAEKQGYKFGSILPTSSHISDIIALENDKQLSHVGFIGHMAYGSGSDDIHRLDYEKYLSGSEEYYI